MIKEIRIPEIGKNVQSGKVVGVLVKPGDRVEEDDGIIDVETEKAVIEIPSPEKGQITEMLVKEGDGVKVGDMIAKIKTETDGGKEEETTARPEKIKDRIRKTEKPELREDVDKRVARKTENAEKEAAVVEEVGKEHPLVAGSIPASPSVRRFAQELGVNLRQLDGTGPSGRITESDVNAFVKSMGTSKDIGENRIGAAEIGVYDLPDLSRWGEVEAVKLSAVHRLIAQSTAVSWQTIPHVTQFEEADVTHLEEFIGAHAEKIRQTGGKLTIIAVIIKICAAALKRFPQFNAASDTKNNRIVYRKYVHIGMDVDTERGVVVPVIRNADKKSISDLAREILDLSERARNKKIKPDELEGAGFTVSNQGGIGGTQFTPIVLWPQAAVIGISRASVVPRYIGGGFEPRTVLPLALSYDHRIADCMDAARFLRWVRESIEQPMTIFL